VRQRIGSDLRVFAQQIAGRPSSGQGGHMKKHTPSRSALHLGRETIRSLSALDLERAAGGATLSEQTVCFRCFPTHPCDPQ